MAGHTVTDGTAQPLIEQLWRLEAAAARLRITRWTLRRLLRAHPEIAPRYARHGRHPRRVRVLSTSDLVRIGRALVDEATQEGVRYGALLRARRGPRRGRRRVSAAPAR